MAGEHLDAVGELEQSVERVEQAFRALGRADGEVGPGRVADEERVAGEHEPRLVAARGVDDREAAVLGPVPGRVDHAERDGADLDLVTVDHRVVRVVDAAAGWMLIGMPCSRASRPWPETWSACVCVSIVRTIASPASLGLVEQRLDREGRIDEHRDAGFFVSHEVTRTAEIVVQELVEDHGATVAPGSRYCSGSERRRKKKRPTRRRQDDDDDRRDRRPGVLLRGRSSPRPGGTMRSAFHLTVALSL